VLQLTINAAGPLDALGRPIQANQGAKFVVTFGKGAISLTRVNPGRVGTAHQA
jgi:hypothetical protein